MACIVASCLDDDAENFLVNFLVHVQIASINLYMATQNCIQNKVLEVPTKSKARSSRVAHQFTETAISRATPVKKHI